jgi:ABC-type multidrug transport system ATPase subunit
VSLENNPEPEELKTPGVGSVWNRWDPHLHAPGTLLNDQFGGDWAKYIGKINTSAPQVRALGVTDYFCIRTYKAVRARWLAGELPAIGLLFPNVEMRLDIKTEKKKAVNIHLLFSPEDPAHQTEIERLLARLSFSVGTGKYMCTESDLIRLGRFHNPSLTDDAAALKEGANQFKVSFQELMDLNRTEQWFRENCLVAVAGSNNDGTAGLQSDSSFALQRRAIETFADIIFASTPSQRAFWLGKSAAADATEIEKTYGFLKPCLHGSDGHCEETTASPSHNRFCWIKGDLTFESMRQVVLEPERRVCIGELPPPDGGGQESIVEVQIDGAPWLATPTVPVNTGLTAVIGSRGSGKTALIEMIAQAAGATGWQSDTSFLLRAAEHLEGARARTTWADGTTYPDAALTESTNLDLICPGVRYLSQHFVERLCSATGLAKELRAELERVVFEATDPSERMETDSFDQLSSILLEPIERSRRELRMQLQETSEAIVQESLAIDALSRTRQERDVQQKVLDKARNDLGKLIPKESGQRAARLAQLESAVVAVSARVEGLRRQQNSIEDLKVEVRQNREVHSPAKLANLRERFRNVSLTEVEWVKFALTYGAEVDAILSQKAELAKRAVAAAVVGDPTAVLDKEKTSLEHWPLEPLIAERDAGKKLVGIDAEMLKRYDALQRQIVQMEGAIRRLNESVESGEKAPARRDALVQRRRIEYQQAFETLLKEEQVLRKLYEPLSTQLTAGRGALGKLTFAVGRRVDVASWAKKGEALLDLRKSSCFRGEGALLEIATERLGNAWEKGTAVDVSAALLGFYNDFRNEFVGARPLLADQAQRRQWEHTFTSWLYDFSHVGVHYSVCYDGIAIEKLSPGTRGIVLLLLYLVLDRSDRRPLIIDQPEENLDPQSVFSELVPHFREARDRRQVIVVTHNANLVINTDADQVIVARSVPSISGGMPTISYTSGSVENSVIRRSICEILEGGERAFKDRAKRYRFRLP